MAPFHEKNRLNDELRNLRTAVPQIVESLQLPGQDRIDSWKHMIDTKLMPRLTPDSPLVVSICGGGSSGKSTLFNSLIKENVSPTGGTAGINRRILISANSNRFGPKEGLAEMFAPFGYRPEPLQEPHELISPGGPRYVLNAGTPSNLILLDTPDFDTGARGVYTNRDMARQALETSDLFIYIFTNANYNSRDNTDFMSKMLTGIGMRKCILVYRVYAGYRQEEVAVHARTVAENIYGERAGEYVLGIYRADEDNRVAADEAFMEVRPIKSGEPGLTEAMARLDVQQIRIDLLGSILKDILQQGDDLIDAAGTARREIVLYRDALQTWQSHCVREALQHFPMDIVLKRFTEIWLRTDPAHIRWMRKAGDIVELPFKALLGTVRWMSGRAADERHVRDSVQRFGEQLEEDLVSAVNSLWRKSVNPEISVSLIEKDPVARGMIRAYREIEAAYREKSMTSPHRLESGDGEEITFLVHTPPAIQAEQGRIRSRNWQEVLQAIKHRKDRIVRISDRIDSELGALVERLRAQMSILANVRQTFSALLNVLPATAAVSYILTTGDPVGAAGIKVKLTGLFGLKDLYALVAIPATTGLKKADQKQLEELLGPMTKSWLEHKLDAIRQLFEEEITGGILGAADHVLASSETGLNLAKMCIQNCRKLTAEARREP